MMADPLALVYLIENDQEIRNIRFHSESVSEDGCEIETKILVRGQRPDFRVDKQISLPWHLTAVEMA